MTNVVNIIQFVLRIRPSLARSAIGSTPEMPDCCVCARFQARHRTDAASGTHFGSVGGSGEVEAWRQELAVWMADIPGSPPALFAGRISRGRWLLPAAGG
jgi:hypothetical protein